MQFLAQIQGGIGPDVWDTECFICAEDFLDAAQQASAKAEEIGGQVTLLEQYDLTLRIMRRSMQRWRLADEH